MVSYGYVSGDTPKAHERELAETERARERVEEALR
jgi:hypothetical protein